MISDAYSFLAHALKSLVQHHHAALEYDSEEKYLEAWSQAHFYENQHYMFYHDKKETLHSILKCLIFLNTKWKISIMLKTLLYYQTYLLGRINYCLLINQQELSSFLELWLSSNLLENLKWMINKNKTLPLNLIIWYDFWD